MPIYEYQCEACGHYFDALQKLADPVLTDCPDCGEPQLRKLVSAPSFRLKGAGWYETDFKGDKDRRRNLHGDHGEGKADAKPGDKSEAKPAAESAKASSADKKKPSTDGKTA